MPSLLKGWVIYDYPNKKHVPDFWEIIFLKSFVPYNVSAGVMGNLRINAFSYRLALREFVMAKNMKNPSDDIIYCGIGCG